MLVDKILLLSALSIVGVLGDHDGPVRATIEFNQQGVAGQIVFTLLDNGSTQINTSFQPGNFSSWHVHPFPVDFTDDPATRCSPALRLGPHYDPSHRMEAAGENYDNLCNSTNPLNCEAGDLSGKFGDLTYGDFMFIDSDPELQLSGRYSIIGRSIVIHPPGGGHLACANIHLDEDDTPGLYVANFMGPTIGGSIYFRQSGLEPDIGVYIYAKLYYTNAVTGTTVNHTWGIYDQAPSNVLDYSQDDCADIGSLFNPTNADANDALCNSYNISYCRVGDLSAKLGYVTINSNPINSLGDAWTDGNLYNYTYVGRSVAIHAANRGDQILACAQIVPVAQIMARANRPPQSSLFTLHQRSPFDPTYINLPANLPPGDYQINRDGNIRDNDMCYSNMIFTPFTPDISENTSDSFAAGNLSGKHNFVANSTIEDIILPLSNRGSALGHNFMITPPIGNSSCGTIDLPAASSDVRVVVAHVNMSMNIGVIYLRQVVTMSNNNMYVQWPTVINRLLRYMTTGMARTENHNWEVGVSSCERSTGQIYNPYGVRVGNAAEMAICSETTGSRYHSRCAVGDLSGKHGQVAIRAEASPPRTLVATDSNLPLVGPYTVLGRSITIYNGNSFLSCGQILPENLSSMRVMLRFPVARDVDHRILLPTAIVDLVNAADVSYGEVIILSMIDAVPSGGSQGCTTVTLGFTHFEGGNADNIAMRVRGLYQDDLPAMYQRGSCAIGDLQERPSGGSRSINYPYVFLINIFILISIFVLVN